ncbi:hypothetical protein [Nocardioides astragali]|uniref:RNA polymerase sigma factor 70 region 4 type 2 domain-containing protein n=1 Tax=Nocardioides astragali TaxID=1776736 RepID=A0ABW2N836_9ACTN|nr:hypothetical protein [Nocardioides astragali]
MLRYHEDLSEAQIADALGCAAATVKSQSSSAAGGGIRHVVIGLNSCSGRRPTIRGRGLSAVPASVMWLGAPPRELIKDRFRRSALRILNRRALVMT